MNIRQRIVALVFATAVLLFVSAVAGPRHDPVQQGDQILSDFALRSASAGDCPDIKCVRWDVTPVICTPAIDNACIGSYPPGQPGSFCKFGLCF